MIDGRRCVIVTWYNDPPEYTDVFRTIYVRGYSKDEAVTAVMRYLFDNDPDLNDIRSDDYEAVEAAFGEFAQSNAKYIRAETVIVENAVFETTDVLDSDYEHDLYDEEDILESARIMRVDPYDAWAPIEPDDLDGLTDTALYLWIGTKMRHWLELRKKRLLGKKPERILLEAPCYSHAKNLFDGFLLYGNEMGRKHLEFMAEDEECPLESFWNEQVPVGREVWELEYFGHMQPKR